MTHPPCKGNWVYRWVRRVLDDLEDCNMRPEIKYSQKNTQLMWDWRQEFGQWGSAHQLKMTEEEENMFVCGLTMKYKGGKTMERVLKCTCVSEFIGWASLVDTGKLRALKLYLCWMQMNSKWSLQKRVISALAGVENLSQLEELKELGFPRQVKHSLAGGEVLF